MMTSDNFREFDDLLEQASMVTVLPATMTREQAYLNSAYVGPIPRSVRDAAVEEADAKMLLPTPGNRSDRASTALFNNRSDIERLLGVLAAFA